jgi:hypothetical protein
MMGIWNVDILMKIDNGIKKSVQFDFQKDLKIDQENLQFFLLFQRNNAVINYSKKNWNKVVFDPKDEMTMMIVLPGGKIVEVDSKQISEKIAKYGPAYFITTPVIK